MLQSELALNMSVLGLALLAMFIAAVISLAMTPLVKKLAEKVGAIDVPRDNRRMHNHPIPRMGGLAIFFGFIVSVLLFSELDIAKLGLLLGAVLIVILGIFDDIYTLSARLKIIVQVIAACIAAFSGNCITVLSNPNFFSNNPYWELGFMSIPITVLWIVGITNAVNLIDGLDGLACGVSAISSIAMLIIALFVSEGDVAVMISALAGACIGFLPYNINPARIFMGDTGSTFLGYILATVSIQGMFKLPTIISFVVPFLMLGLPIFDVAFAFFRRLLKGQNPMHPDRGHIHHRLIDRGFSQKQTVGILYVVSAILGMSAVLLTTSGAIKAMIFLASMVAAGLVAARLFLHANNEVGTHKKEDSSPAEDNKGQESEEQKNE